MSEETTTTEAVPERKPLTPFERGIQVVAFVAAGIGLLAMVGYLVLLWAMGYRVNSNIDPQVTAFVGDFIGGVAGALFALAATLLFYLALRVQRKEFQNSVDELRQSRLALTATEEHHKNSLEVMRQEKEFNVCMAAIKDLEEDWVGLRGKNTGWMRITSAWGGQFKAPGFYMPKGAHTKYQLGQKEVFDFQAYKRIVDLIDRSDWVVGSIRDKTLSPDDRNYLAQMARPILGDMRAHVKSAVRAVEKSVDLLIAQENSLKSHNVDSDAIIRHKEKLRSTLLQRLDGIRAVLDGL